MHLVPNNRQNRRIIDSERVCAAIEALGEPSDVVTWAKRFSLLSDPSRLALLVAIAQAGPISVTDLAVATDMIDTTVSQALRLLRAAGTVIAERDGRVIRYTLADDEVGRLLGHLAGSPIRSRRSAP